MTDDQIELAARKYCELACLDPHVLVAHGADPDPSGFVVDVLLHSPLWTRIARDIKRTARIMDAIEYAKHLPQQERE